jgi:NADH-quinone oxidoreductase subunit C
MSHTLEHIAEALSARFAGKLLSVRSHCGELTFEVEAPSLLEVCVALRDEQDWRFEQLIDVTGVDYLTYGQSDWTTDAATSSGFSRGRTQLATGTPQQSDAAADGGTPASDGQERRFAAVYHLLSVTHNRRLRLRAFAEAGEPPMLDSVVGIWSSADWFEREAFDLFGIIFRGHPDLRRILTDYGFVGHPFRKDFPLIGNVEVRYDAEKGRVVYEPVSIEPRTLVPRVIRDDNRYQAALKDPPRHG